MRLLYRLKKCKKITIIRVKNYLIIIRFGDSLIYSCLVLIDNFIRLIRVVFLMFLTQKFVIQYYITYNVYIYLNIIVYFFNYLLKCFTVNH